MWDWIRDNSSALSLVVSAAMLVVWIVYLQLLLQSLRRERRAKILINRGVGSGLRSRCLLSNMSAEAIYIHSLAARLGDSEAETFASVTDLVGQDDDHPTDIRDATLQGPVAAGEFRDVGTFESILRRAGWSPDTGPESGSGDQRRGPVELELTVLATYRSEDLIVGARRSFDVTPDTNGANWTIKPRSAVTTQIRAKKERKALHDAYIDYLS